MLIFGIGILVLTVIAVIVASVLMTMTRLVSWAVNFLFPSKPVQPLPALKPPMQRCRRANCRTGNPMHARFCRRCGVSLAAAQVDLRKIAAVL